jgi:hypothetical protein
MSAFRKSRSEQPATKIVKTMFDCLRGLADLNSTLRSSADSKKKTFSPDVEMMVALGDMIKDWEIEAEDLEGRNGYYAELLTDKKSLSQIVVLYTRRNKKGLFPVLYLPVPFEGQASAVLEEALSTLNADQPATRDAA